MVVLGGGAGGAVVVCITAAVSGVCVIVPPERVESAGVCAMAVMGSRQPAAMRNIAVSVVPVAPHLDFIVHPPRSIGPFADLRLVTARRSARPNPLAHSPEPA